MQVNPKKEDQCCVLRVSLQDGRELVMRADFAEGNLHRYQANLKRHQTAAEALKFTTGVSVPQILWCDPQYKYTLMELAPGDTAFQALYLAGYGLGDRDRLLQRIGAAVAALHRCSETDEQVFWPMRHLETVSRTAGTVRAGEVTVVKPKRFLGLCAYLHRAGRRARGVRYQPGLAHGDLHFRNILASDDQISFIDFSSQRFSIAERDISNLWLANGLDHLSGLDGDAGFGGVSQADWAAFEEGYGRHVSREPLFQFCFALRLWESWIRFSASGRAAGKKGQRQLEQVVKVLDLLLDQEPG
ncbi:aminoglycoside phosphotransferase family protein [Leisingera sp. NJS204]|uniref:aminoglycoside phosphotransferase family protein n=1 Tax=Leisingera sp. NJS204 TaxID=2508307 RepID=UPI001980A4E1|nr:phosphotransferase [Leisingera sp. NJS204]